MKLSFDFGWFKNEEPAALGLTIALKVDKDFFTLFQIKVYKFIIGAYLIKV